VKIVGRCHFYIPALCHGLIGAAHPLTILRKVFYRIGLALDLGLRLRQSIGFDEDMAKVFI
jgi:hypothetical protein